MTGIIYSGTVPPDTALVMMESTVKNTTIPTTSSSTAIGRSVSVTGPLVWNSWTIESAGAGAVAKAIPPNAAARYTGIPEKWKMIPNTSVTTANVPNDCVSVVSTRALP